MGIGAFGNTLESILFGFVCLLVLAELLVLVYIALRALELFRVQLGRMLPCSVLLIAIVAIPAHSRGLFIVYAIATIVLYAHLILYLRTLYKSKGYSVAKSEDKASTETCTKEEVGDTKS